jgi:hypothetical protein
VYCCAWRHWGYMVLPYCYATKYLSSNLATRRAMRSEGKGGEVRRGSAPLLLCNRIPRGFWILSPPAWGNYTTICVCYKYLTALFKTIISQVSIYQDTFNVLTFPSEASFKINWSEQNILIVTPYFYNVL